MLKRILANICIIMLLVFLTLFIIDQINSAMGFVNNQITKVLMIITLPVTVVTLFMYVADLRAEERRLARQNERRRPIEGAEQRRPIAGAETRRPIASAETRRPIAGAEPVRRRYDR